MIGSIAITKVYCRSPYGERGLKYAFADESVSGMRRSPYGERGLKLSSLVNGGGCDWSLSLRRAWIEIKWASDSRRLTIVALLTESVD